MERENADLLAALATAPLPVHVLLQRAGSLAEALGVEAYAVGGFLRDLLIGRSTSDLDIAIVGDGIAYAQALGQALGAEVEEVPRFGTAHLLLAAPLRRVDIATARRERYDEAGALPTVAPASLKDDLYRRDFTVNALAVRLRGTGPCELVDPFDGVADLQGGLIRILHPQSFVEDPTRVLRAARFASRYGFALAAETERLARQAVADALFDRVSWERLTRELILILQEESAAGALALLADLGALGHLLPGVRLTPELIALLGRVEATVLASGAPSATAWLTRLLLLLHQFSLHEGLALMAQLKLRRGEARAAQQALQAWRPALDLLTDPSATPCQVVKALAPWAPEGLTLLALLGAGDRATDYWQRWRHVRLAISGADLLAAGLPPGPAVQRILDRVLCDRLDGRAPDREAQLALALSYLAQEA